MAVKRKRGRRMHLSKAGRAAVKAQAVASGEKKPRSVSTKPRNRALKSPRVSELVKSKVLSLHVMGFKTNEISERFELSPTGVLSIIKEATETGPVMTRTILIAHVADRFINVIQNHKHTNAELFTMLIDLQSARDTLRQVIKSTKEAVVAGSKVAVAELRFQIKQLTDLGSQISSTSRDLTRNDKDFVEMVTRMGVPDPSPSDKDKVPTQADSVGNLTYLEDQDKKAQVLIDEIRVGNERQRKWLQEQEAQ